MSDILPQNHRQKCFHKKISTHNQLVATQSVFYFHPERLRKMIQFDSYWWVATNHPTSGTFCPYYSQSCWIPKDTTGLAYHKGGSLLRSPGSSWCSKNRGIDSCIRSSQGPTWCCDCSASDDRRKGGSQLHGFLGVAESDPKKCVGPWPWGGRNFL